MCGVTGARIASLHHLSAALSRVADKPRTAVPRFSTRPSVSTGSSVTLQNFTSILGSLSRARISADLSRNPGILSNTPETTLQFAVYMVFLTSMEKVFQFSLFRRSRFIGIKLDVESYESGKTNNSRYRRGLKEYWIDLKDRTSKDRFSRV